MNINISYVFSQVFIIINYALLMFTYQQNNRRNILIINLVAQLATGVSYLCLSAYTGIAMVFVSILRNLIFYIDEEHNGTREKLLFKDYLIFLFITLILVILAVFTYNGFLSLMAVFATLLYTFSVWQKNTKIYKFLGVPVSVMGILYNIFIVSIFGIVLESIVLISAIVGLFREKSDYFGK